MASSASTLSSYRPTATPLKRRRISVPSSRRLLQPLDDLLGLLRIMTLQRSPLEYPLHRLGHVQPGGSQRRVEHHNSSGEHPQKKFGSLVPSEVVQNHQHPQRRQLF